jgi:hypothetical protein
MGQKIGEVSGYFRMDEKTNVVEGDGDSEVLLAHVADGGEVVNGFYLQGYVVDTPRKRAVRFLTLHAGDFDAPGPDDQVVHSFRHPGVEVQGDIFGGSDVDQPWEMGELATEAVEHIDAEAAAAAAAYAAGRLKPADC